MIESDTYLRLDPSLWPEYEIESLPAKTFDVPPRPKGMGTWLDLMVYYGRAHGYNAKGQHHWAAKRN